jgi:hypothetical protein
MLAPVKRRYTTPFDLLVTFGEVPPTLDADTGSAADTAPGQATRPPGRVVGDRSRALVSFPDAWSLLVEHGRSATVAQTGPDPVPGWVVDGWAIPIAALQRGYLCLHATVVDIDGAAVAIAGESGAGKSTTAAALTQRGHHLIVDDTAIVDLTPHGPVVLPFERPVHLTEDATTMLGIPTEGLEHDPRSNKRLWNPLAQPVAHDPVALGAIVLLDPNGTGTVDAEALTGANKVAQVAHHAARRNTAIELLGPQGVLACLAALCEAVPVWMVRRPPQSPTLDAVADAIETVAGTASR